MYRRYSVANSDRRGVAAAAIAADRAVGRDGPAGYTFRLDDAEVKRFRAMAANAEQHEHELWILAHVATLLRPGGSLVSVEPDVDGLDFGDAAAERDYERRWCAMVRHDGNDPALGRGDRLPQLLKRHGWHVLEMLSWIDELVIDRSPAWAAADRVLTRGFATADELARWRRAMHARRSAGPLRCSLSMTTVVATPDRSRP